MVMVMVNNNLKVVSFETVADGSLSRPPKAEYAIITAEGADARWRDDGTAPTLDVGHIIPMGKRYFYKGDLTKVKIKGTVSVTYYSNSKNIS